MEVPLYFKFLLVKKRWNIFITCQQKMVHLTGTRVSAKSIFLNIPCKNIIDILYHVHIFGIQTTLFCLQSGATMRIF